MPDDKVPHKKGTTDAPRNNLSFADKFRVAQWLGIHQEKLRADRPTWTEATEAAAKELGIKLTEINLRSIAKDMGTDWSPKIKGRVKGGLQPIWDTLNAIRPDVEEAKGLIQQLLNDNQALHRKSDLVAAQLAEVRAALTTLAKEAGAMPPRFAPRNDAAATSIAGRN